MALLVGGEVEAADAAYDWCLRHQRADGSWPMKVVGDQVEDASGDTNMTAYLAVGVWHHWLVRRDPGSSPAVAGRPTRAGLRRRACSCRSAGIAWSATRATAVNRRAARRQLEHLHVAARRARARRAASASRSRTGSWRPGGCGTPCRAPGRVRWTRRRSRWTGTTRCSAGAVREPRRDRLLAQRWDDFVVAGLGVPLRRHQPLGDRRGDLRAGARARRARRPACALGLLGACSTRGTRAGSTGPATSTTRACSGRWSRRRTPRPPSSSPPTRCPARRGGNGLFRGDAYVGPRGAPCAHGARVRLLRRRACRDPG